MLFRSKYLGKLNVWNYHDILEIVIVFGIAIVLYLAMDHFRFFSRKMPDWLSVEYLVYRPAAHFFLHTCCNFGAQFDSAINKAYLKSGKVSAGVCNYVNMFDASINDAYEKSGGVARRLADRTEQFDTSLNDAYEKSGGVARRLADRTEQFDTSLNEAYEKSGEIAKRMATKTAELDGALDEMYEQSGQRSRSIWERLRGRPSDWNIKNLNFDSLLMALMLGVFLFILYYYTRIT